MSLVRLSIASLVNRWLTVSLTICTIALSVILLLGVEKIRTGAKQGFLQTISGTDLIVGARSGGVQLLLYSVFHIGNPTNNVTMETISELSNRPEVAWIVPVSLGDSYRRFRVVGTTNEFFDRFKYRSKLPLQFSAGTGLSNLTDIVLGSQAAREYNHKIGDSIIISHGTGEVSFSDHKKNPFKVSGILAQTGTPVDRSVFVSLEAIEAIHKGLQPSTGNGNGNNNGGYNVEAVTAAFVGLKSKIQTLTFQRYVNDYKSEPVTAILPGVAFAELWRIVGNVELALIAISVLVVFTAIIGMMIAILSTLNERRREMAILRSIGARPVHILSLFMGEAVLIAITGIVIGVFVLYAVLFSIRPHVERMIGINIEFAAPATHDLILLAAVFVSALVCGSFPAIRAYRMSLADGLSIKV